MNAQPQLQRAATCFRMAARMRMRLYRELRRGYDAYGQAGNVLSGGHCEHWPDPLKRRIRRLNRACNRLDNAGFAARPRYVQMHTMRNLRLTIISEVMR